MKPTSEQLPAGLYLALDPETGKVRDMDIKDICVDNLKNSRGGGLQAHNYWDNQQEFIEPVVKLLKDLVQQEKERVAS